MTITGSLREVGPLMETLCWSLGEMPNPPKMVNFLWMLPVRGDLVFIRWLLEWGGDFLDAMAAKVKCASPLAESLGLVPCFLSWLRDELCGRQLLLDCLSLVSAVRGSTIPSWKLTNLFLHLFSCLNFDAKCCVFWIPRKDNSLAHNVAAWAASHNIFRSLCVGDVALLVATLD
uniref:RNase H type-1 domain-containing protein n=1 Tax=Cannabis sativa TaxID=3483 RepID=A0A803NNP3_CANSA